jgi:tetratricopeptide (TPR) repeat protein
MSTALFTQGKLEAMRGRPEVGRELVGRARALLEEVALTMWTAGPMTQMAGWVELLADDPAAAERTLRPAVEELREIGELAWVSTNAGILAEAVYAQRRYEEAEEVLGAAEEVAGSDDAYSQALLRGIKAKLHAQRGRHDEAVRLGREAVGIAETTDFLFLQTFALSSLAEVLRIAGRGEEAEEALAETIRVAERKGFTVAAERARAERDRAVTQA